MQNIGSDTTGPRGGLHDNFVTKGERQKRDTGLLSKTSLKIKEKNRILK